MSRERKTLAQPTNTLLRHDRSPARSTQVDIPVSLEQRAPIRFTFYWPAGECWEGRDYAVQIDPHASCASSGL